MVSARDTFGLRRPIHSGGTPVTHMLAVERCRETPQVNEGTSFWREYQGVHAKPTLLSPTWRAEAVASG